MIRTGLPFLLGASVLALAAPAVESLEEILRGAQQRVAAGRRLFTEGNINGARAEFDRAIGLILAAPEATVTAPGAERRIAALVDQIYRYDVESLGAGEFNAAPEFDRSPLDEIRELTFPIDPKLKNRVRQEVEATVSQIPLTINDSVLSFVNYFSSERGRRTVLYGLRRSGRYRDMIQRILAEEGVPQELMYLAQAESGFMPRAVSYRAAVGMWQFVKFRGNEYGLKQTPLYDDRLDPEKATRAAARHLRDLYMQLGDWRLAMAAYNCGPGCVERAVQRTGYADYWELRERGALPKETRNYVPIITAMTIVLKNAKDYGIEDKDPDPPMVYDTLQLPTDTSLQLLADILDTTVSTLKDLNPALLKSTVPANYDLHVPRGTASLVRSALEMVPAEKRLGWRVHRVAQGEDLDTVARLYKVTSAALKTANRLDDGACEPGDLVAVPLAPVVEKAVRKGAARASAGTRTATRRNATRTSKTKARKK
ncbi:MAG: lytic transglycosylase [Acidobacteria bacterium]|nr:lytic transglycosylase [Acidobacteriota bacterium]